MEKYLKKIAEQKETIRKVNLSQLWLEEVPELLKNCPLLEDIDLTGNQIYELPNWLFELPNLRKLYLAFNDLEDIPESIRKAINLEDLSFDVPVNGQIPTYFSELKKLKRLAINDTIQGFPEGFFELPALEELEFYSSQIRSFPEEIGKLKNLKSIAIMQLDFEKDAVPIDYDRLFTILAECPKLVKVNLSKSGMKQIPPSINKPKQIKELEIGSNGIKKITPELCELTNLHLLNLEVNQIAEVPIEIRNLKNLRTLMLNSNHSPKIQVQNLFAHIENFQKLQKLDLSHCQTSMQIPENIAMLRSIKELDLDNNNIKSLPQSMAIMTGLKKLRISNNPIPENEKRILVDALKNTKVII